MCWFLRISPVCLPGGDAERAVFFPPQASSQVASSIVCRKSVDAEMCRGRDAAGKPASGLCAHGCTERCAASLFLLNLSLQAPLSRQNLQECHPAALMAERPPEGIAVIRRSGFHIPSCPRHLSPFSSTFSPEPQGAANLDRFYSNRPSLRRSLRRENANDDTSFGISLVRRLKMERNNPIDKRWRGKRGIIDIIVVVLSGMPLPPVRSANVGSGLKRHLCRVVGGTVVFTHKRRSLGA